MKSTRGYSTTCIIWLFPSPSTALSLTLNSLFPPKHLHFLDAVTWLSMWPPHLASLPIWIISIIQVIAFSFLDCIVLPLSWHLFCFAFELLLTFSLAEIKCTVHVTMSFFTFFSFSQSTTQSLTLAYKMFLDSLFPRRQKYNNSIKIQGL